MMRMICIMTDSWLPAPSRIAIKIAIAPTTKTEIQDNCRFVKETAQQP
jgi:hypothetical protein